MNQSDQSTPAMAADRTGTTRKENADVHSSDLGFAPDQGCNILKRSRVTVKYNRKELQKRLDVEKWIDDCLDRLYQGQVGGCDREQRGQRETAQAALIFKDTPLYCKTIANKKFSN